MNEQLQAKIVEILSQLQQIGKDGASFAISQLPDIAQQYIVYGRTINTSLLILSFIAAYCAYVLIKTAFKCKGYEEEGKQIVCGLSGLVTSFAAFVLFMVNISDFMMFWFAPKIALLTFASRLIK